MAANKRSRDHDADAPPAMLTRSRAQGVPQEQAAAAKKRRRDGDLATTRALEKARLNAETVLKEAAREAQNAKRRQIRTTQKKKEHDAAQREKYEARQQADQAAKSAEVRRRKAEAARNRRQAIQARRTPSLPASSEAYTLTTQSPIVVRSSPPPSSPAPPSTPMGPPTRPVGARSPINSSPPLLSSPSKELDYDVGVTYSVYVNTARKAREDEIPIPRSSFTFGHVEDVVERLIASPASTVGGRDYTYRGRTVQSKVGKSAYQYTNLEDFSESECMKVWAKIEHEILKRPLTKRLFPIRVQLRVDVRIEVQAHVKAMLRTTGDPSSDPPIATPQRNTTTAKQLRDAERMQQRNAAFDKGKLIDYMHTFWACKVPACGNHFRWCYVPPNQPHAHYEMREHEMETFAVACMKDDGPTITQPPPSLVQEWMSRPSKLLVNPHNKRKQKQKRSGSSSDDSNNSDRTDSLMKMLERQAQLSLMKQIATPTAQAPVPYPHPHMAPSYPYHLYPLNAGYPPPPTPLAPSAPPQESTSRIADSSPITQGRSDSRAAVKAFFNWLIEHAEEETRDEYERTRDVAIQEMWTIADLQDMSILGSNLYRMATAEPHKLKDGIIRHFKDDLRRFKPVYRCRDS